MIVTLQWKNTLGNINTSRGVCVCVCACMWAQTEAGTVSINKCSWIISIYVVTEAMDMDKSEKQECQKEGKIKRELQESQIFKA